MFKKDKRIKDCRVDTVKRPTLISEPKMAAVHVSRSKAAKMLLRTNEASVYVQSGR